METCAGSRLIVGEFRESAVIAAAAESLAECGGQPSCGFLFLSASWLPHIHEVLDLVRLHGRIPLLVGALGSGLIGRGKEAEGVAGMSLLLLSLPETKMTPIVISNEQIEESTGPAYWQMETGIGPEEVDSWIVLANPYAPNLERWLAEWNVAFPEAPSIGGLSSGSTESGDQALLLDGKMIDAAVLALAVKGGKIRTIVSQGCKPVGEPFTITQADENLVYALGSRPAYQVLSETFNGLSDDEKERARGNLFAGLAASEYVADLKRGDFLVRNLLGADPDTGAVAIGARARTGQTLQYQLRDKITAHADLVELSKISEMKGCKPLASLVFSCNGRGARFFGIPDHDAKTLSEVFGPMPSAGFFCNGEIGPIGNASYLHGYTASIALFCK
jgi:small ligand-binding sensory domain FIST